MCRPELGLELISREQVCFAVVEMIIALVPVVDSMQPVTRPAFELFHSDGFHRFEPREFGQGIIEIGVALHGQAFVARVNVRAIPWSRARVKAPSRFPVEAVQNVSRAVRQRDSLQSPVRRGREINKRQLHHFFGLVNLHRAAHRAGGVTQNCLAATQGLVVTLDDFFGIRKRTIHRGEAECGSAAERQRQRNEPASSSHAYLLTPEWDFA